MSCYDDLDDYRTPTREEANADAAALGDNEPTDVGPVTEHDLAIYPWPEQLLGGDAA